MSTRDLPLWRRQAERGSPVLMRAIARFARLFGRRAAGSLLPPICLYFIAASPAARRASRRYLARALGRAPRFADVYRHFHAFATTLLDRVFWRTEGVAGYDIGFDGVD
ncbi:MAG: acyl-CoA synthetase, partial [Burkholderiales bacterium]